MIPELEAVPGVENVSALVDHCSRRDTQKVMITCDVVPGSDASNDTENRQNASSC